MVWHGVAAAMAALNGGRGGPTGLTDEDRAGIYAHLVAHYEQFEEEPPELRAMREDEEVDVEVEEEEEEEKMAAPRSKDLGRAAELLRDALEILDGELREDDDDDEEQEYEDELDDEAIEVEEEEEEEVYNAAAILIEKQAEHTQAMTQLVDVLGDLTKRIHATDQGERGGGSSRRESAPDAPLPKSTGEVALDDAALQGLFKMVENQMGIPPWLANQGSTDTPNDNGSTIR